MPSARTLWLAVVVAALTGGVVVDTAHAGSKDELAKGDWEGKRTNRADRGGGGGGDGGEPGPVDGDDPGTATPEPGAGAEPDAEEPDDDGAVATEPDEPAPEGEPEEPGAEPEGEPDPDDGTVEWPQPADAPLSGCTAWWQFEETPSTPSLVEQRSLLTLLLWREDATGYLCNGYARAESTWYVDWVATTRATHQDENGYEVLLTLVRECPVCRPSIRIEGASFLETKAQVKTSWGAVSMNSTASATVNATWQGTLDAGDGCAVTVRSGKGGGSYGVGFGGVKAETSTGQQFVHALALAGRADGETVQGGRVRQKFTNRGHLLAYAADTENNVQAKLRAGQELAIEARTACGATASYTLERIDR